MGETTCYMDGFSKSFDEPQELLGFLREREENAAWQTVPTRLVEFQAIDEETLSGKMLLQSYKAMGKEGLIEDTLQNTRLLLKAEDNVYPVRNCAIATILSRARISGNALSKVKKDVLAQILNYCVGVASGNALLRLSDEKVSAMHGGDESEYAILQTPMLFEKVTERLAKDFAGFHFAGGHFDHSMVTAIWDFPDNMELLDAYQEALDTHGINIGKFKPAVRFSTSDTGVSGANLYPLLLAESNGRSITLGSPLKLEHKHGADLEKFEAQLGLLYPRYIDAVEQLGKLMEVYVNYPYNTMLRVMKRVGVTKKLAYQVAEQWVAQHGETGCTAHDLYLAMCEATFILQCDGASGSKVAQMEENVSRALKIKWEDYDYAGDVKW